jgi:pimeloyl-ACP methyl ester carboxylesterase
MGGAATQPIDEPVTLAGPHACLAARRVSGRGPGFLFLSGFQSDMSGTKAQFLAETCAAHGRGFVRFDYSGCGLSGGVFTEGTIGRWRDDALAVIDSLLPPGPAVLVGSSMGGWIALLCALARPDRVAAIIGLAAAPDFTRGLAERLTPAQRESLAVRGFFQQASAYGAAPYIFTRALLEDGEAQALLDRPIPLSCPVRLIHGQADPDVPWRLSLALGEKLAATDVEITLVKDGDHRLSKPHELALLARVLEGVLAAIEPSRG